MLRVSHLSVVIGPNTRKYGKCFISKVILKFYLDNELGSTVNQNGIHRKSKERA